MSDGVETLLQKKRVAASFSFVESYENDRNLFLDQVITGDET